MPMYKVREEGEFEWWECEAFDARDAAIRYAEWDYRECDGWERNDEYTVVVQGPLTGDCHEYTIVREFEPVFYVRRTTGQKTDMED